MVEALRTGCESLAREGEDQESSLEWSRRPDLREVVGSSRSMLGSATRGQVSHTDTGTVFTHWVVRYHILTLGQ